MNNKSFEQIARTRSLMCAFIVRIQQNQVFSRRGPYDNES